MNYTVTISISYLLASQKILKFRISVGSSEILVRPSDLHPCACASAFCLHGCALVCAAGRKVVLVFAARACYNLSLSLIVILHCTVRPYDLSVESGTIL